MRSSSGCESLWPDPLPLLWFTYCSSTSLHYPLGSLRPHVLAYKSFPSQCFGVLSALANTIVYPELGLPPILWTRTA